MATAIEVGLAATLGEALTLAEYYENDPVLTDHTVTYFEDSGVLTRNAGFVLKLEDGSEFQVKVVQSK